MRRIPRCRRSLVGQVCPTKGSVLLPWRPHQHRPRRQTRTSRVLRRQIRLRSQRQTLRRLQMSAYSKPKRSFPSTTPVSTIPWTGCQRTKTLEVTLPGQVRRTRLSPPLILGMMAQCPITQISTQIRLFHRPITMIICQPLARMRHGCPRFHSLWREMSQVLSKMISARFSIRSFPGLAPFRILHPGRISQSCSRWQNVASNRR